MFARKKSWGIGWWGIEGGGAVHWGLVTESSVTIQPHLRLVIESPSHSFSIQTTCTPELLF